MRYLFIYNTKIHHDFYEKYFYMFNSNIFFSHLFFSKDPESEELHNAFYHKNSIVVDVNKKKKLRISP